VHEALANSPTDVSTREDSTTENTPRVRTETIPASSTLRCPETEKPSEHLESENAARVLVEDALSLSRKPLTSSGVMVFDEFIFLQVVNNAGVIRAEEYPRQAGSAKREIVRSVKVGVKVDRKLGSKRRLVAAKIWQSSLSI
jgi:hypothetical protein